MEAREIKTMYQVEEDHWWFRGKRLALEALLSQVELPAGGLTLDVGCGTGAVLDLLGRHGLALGLEYDPVCLDLACRRPGLALVRGRSSALPLISGSAGLITIMDVLYHSRVEVAATLAECHRVLMPGGWLLIFDSAYQGLMGPHDVSMHGGRRFARQGLALRAQRAGFSVVRATYRNTFLAPAVIAQRLLRKLISRWQGPTAAPPLSDVALPPASLNRLLAGLMTLEARWLQRRNFCLGTTVCLLARK